MGDATQQVGQTPFVEPDDKGSIAGRLEVINEPALAELELDWSFISELLGDIMAMRESTIHGLLTAMQANDHENFAKTAHSLKGAASNLRLTGLFEVTRQAEWVGKELQRASDTTNATYRRLLNRRSVLIGDLELEYARLEEYVPLAKQRAQEEMAAGSEAGVGDDEGGEFQDDGQ